VIACVLRSGGAYKPEHVRRLQAQAAKFAPDVTFVCLSDVRVPGVMTWPLRHDWPGWWSKIELFRHSAFGVGARVLYLDLDTTIVGDLRPLLDRPEPFLALANFYVRAGRQTVGGELGSGLMQWTAGDMGHIYDRFAVNPDGIMANCGGYGDQLFIHNEAGERAYWQDVVPDAVVSYKVHCAKGVPESAKVVCYHGRPRPWEVEA
jgi:hypothetical protein